MPTKVFFEILKIRSADKEVRATTLFSPVKETFELFFSGSLLLLLLLKKVINKINIGNPENIINFFFTNHH